MEDIAPCGLRSNCLLLQTDGYRQMDRQTCIPTIGYPCHCVAPNTGNYSYSIFVNSNVGIVSFSLLDRILLPYLEMLLLEYPCMHIINWQSHIVSGDLGSKHCTTS